MGNLLRRDEGLGIQSTARLQERFEVPEDVLLLDGGTLGLELLHYLEGADRVLVLDAALTEGPPGTLIRLANDEVPAFFGKHSSPHDISLPDMLGLLQLRGLSPREVVVWGMQPAMLELGWDLSDVIAATGRDGGFRRSRAARMGRYTGPT